MCNPPSKQFKHVQVEPAQFGVSFFKTNPYCTFSAKHLISSEANSKRLPGLAEERPEPREPREPGVPSRLAKRRRGEEEEILVGWAAYSEVDPCREGFLRCCIFIDACCICCICINMLKYLDMQ